MPRPSLIDLTGRQFGRLTVRYRLGTETSPSGCTKPLWWCVCACGSATTVRGGSRSCGCLRVEQGRRVGLARYQVATATKADVRRADGIAISRPEIVL